MTKEGRREILLQGKGMHTLYVVLVQVYIPVFHLEIFDRGGSSYKVRVAYLNKGCGHKPFLNMSHFLFSVVTLLVLVASACHLKHTK